MAICLLPTNFPTTKLRLCHVRRKPLPVGLQVTPSTHFHLLTKPASAEEVSVESWCNESEVQSKADGVHHRGTIVEQAFGSVGKVREMGFVWY